MVLALADTPWSVPTKAAKRTPGIWPRVRLTGGDSSLSAEAASRATLNRVTECNQVVGLAAAQVGVNADDWRRVRLCTSKAPEAEVEQGLQPGRWMGAGKELGRITVDGRCSALQHRTQIRSENRFVKRGFQHLLARVDQASQT